MKRMVLRVGRKTAGQVAANGTIAIVTPPTSLPISAPQGNPLMKLSRKEKEGSGLKGRQ